MDVFFESPQSTIHTLWWTTLAVGLVVALVVAGLLAWIVREASVILARVSEIWNLGQRVANNTAHIPSLYATNALAVRILDAAQRIGAGAGQIEAHARSCSGCPQCLAVSKCSASNAPGSNARRD